MPTEHLTIKIKYILATMAMLCHAAAPLLADQTPAATPPAKVRVACVGDSITQGVFVDPAYRWTTVLQNDLGPSYADISEGVLASSVRPVIGNVAGQTRCRVIDLAPVLQSHPKDTLDHVHPTIAGHLLIGNAIAAAIMSQPITVPQGFPKIGFIGDSITAGYNQVGETITPRVNDVATLTLKKLSETHRMALVDQGVPWSAYDQGSSGSSTKDWLPSLPDGLEDRAKSAFVTAFGEPNPRTNPVWILVMLGTNDVRSDNLFSAEQHQEDMLAITQDLVSSGFDVVINFPPSFVTPTSFNGVTWSASALDLLRSYLPEERSVVVSFAHSAPGRVYLGDTSAFGEFETRPTLFQEYGVYGGLHPRGDGGTQALADLWAASFVRITHMSQKDIHG